MLLRVREFSGSLTCRHPVDERKVNVRIGLLALFLVSIVGTAHTWVSEVRGEKYVSCVGTNRLVERSSNRSASNADRVTCELVVIICNESAPRKPANPTAPPTKDGSAQEPRNLPFRTEGYLFNSVLTISLNGRYLHFLTYNEPCDCAHDLNALGRNWLRSYLASNLSCSAEKPT